MNVLDGLQLEDLNEVWQQIAGIIGMDNVKKLFEEFPGANVYFPKLDDLERSHRNKHIRAEFNGYNFRELAKKYGLTEVSIRNIVSDRVREIRAQPLDGQMSLL